MYIHIEGDGTPTDAPDFKGQIYLDTSQTPPGVYLAVSESEWRCADDTESGEDAPTGSPLRDGQMFIATGSPEMFYGSGGQWHSTSAGTATGIQITWSTGIPESPPTVPGQIFFDRTPGDEKLFMGVVFSGGAEDLVWELDTRPTELVQLAYDDEFTLPTVAPTESPSMQVQYRAEDANFAVYIYEDSAWALEQGQMQTSGTSSPPAELNLYEIELDPFSLHKSAVAGGSLWMKISNEVLTL